MKNKTIVDGSVSPELLDMSGVDSIVIENGNNCSFQNEQVEKYIERMKLKERIKTLEISLGVELRNLEVLKYFPNIEKFFIRSETVQSFQGLEHLKNAKALGVNTGKNKKRCLDELACYSTLLAMSLEFGNWGDYEAIGKCTSLTNLDIGHGPSPDFKSWHKLPVSFLKFWNYCNFSELDDMAYLSNLSSVMIGACQKFERFRGDNSGVKELTIEGSKHFDIASLRTCPSIEKLRILGSIPILHIDEFPILKKVKIVEIVDVKIDVGSLELESKMPSLKTIYFTKGAKDDIISLSKNNSNVLVCKNGRGYFDGVLKHGNYEWITQNLGCNWDS